MSTDEIQMEKHFVIFFSPGTLMAEQTEQPIDSWDVEQAKKMASGITERYDATPYAFQFSTRSRKADELDSRVTKTSGMYFINCKVRTLAEVEADAKPEESTLLANMKGNSFTSVAQTVSGWKWTQPVRDGDVVLVEEVQS